ncbi:hypothetical protein FGO68_gene16139 [Halteria grandinella]|uniref:Uncharacterized protein n=1 Tax=Halteria grandinella TaxID=5974 RepID=A0A8J8T4Z1_HALGN|nr:hypothetical protein FGO68_gene16139 [Halteria grandinella]
MTQEEETALQNTAIEQKAKKVRMANNYLDLGFDKLEPDELMVQRNQLTSQQEQRKLREARHLKSILSGGESNRSLTSFDNVKTPPQEQQTAIVNYFSIRQSNQTSNFQRMQLKKVNEEHTRNTGIINGHQKNKSSLDQRNPMVSFMTLDQTANQESIRQAKQRIRELNKKIQGLDNGKQLVKEVLHNSYWKYKQSHFDKKQNPLPCLLGLGSEDPQWQRPPIIRNSRQSQKIHHKPRPPTKQLLKRGTLDAAESPMNFMSDNENNGVWFQELRKRGETPGLDKRVRQCAFVTHVEKRSVSPAYE